MIGFERRSIWEIGRKYGIEVKGKWYEQAQAGDSNGTW